jgi:DNA-binding response OmpR family regulator
MTKPSPAGRRILIVDDDESLRRLLLLTLPSEGYELVEARDGSEALEQLARALPDLVVLDWKMPGAGGADVLDAAKKLDPALPVIVLTAELKRIPRTLAESLGADVYLTKPFSPLELLDRVEGLLGERVPHEPP